MAELTLAELEGRITELAGELNAANYRWLVLIAEFDRRRGWGNAYSCAHWLSWKCGLDRGAAREKVRVARALEALPQISSAMAAGHLSYSKVRALTRVATSESEGELLTVALRNTADHVETFVRHYRRAIDSVTLSLEAQQFANRGVRFFHDQDGSLVLEARLTAEAGAVMLEALNAATDLTWRGCTGRAEGQAPAQEGVSAETGVVDDALNSLTHRRADALALFAETFLKHGLHSLGGGERQQIVVHVDAASLRESAEPGRCEIENGPVLAVDTARRLACDASVVTVVEDADGQPLDVGRKTRSIPSSIRRALSLRDRCCRYPGCDHTRFLDGHHIRHWVDGGETRLSNLVMLCRFHHRKLHEGGFEIRVLDDGALRFVDVRGRESPRSAGPSSSVAPTVPP